MSEYFIVANSKAAAFVSDRSEEYIEANNSEDALKKFMNNYSHPAGLYFANVYENADAYHKKLQPVNTYKSERYIQRMKELNI